MNYLCLTADIINSRDINNDLFLQDLSKKLEEANERLKPEVPISLNAGDELQGLWAESANVFEITVLLQAILYPLRIRIGYGLGSLSSAIESSTRGMRGEVFIEARQALGNAKKKHGYICYKSIMENHELLSTSLQLLNALIVKWDRVTYRRFLLYRESREIYSVAKSENVSPEAINKYLNRHHIRTVLSAIESF